MSVEDKKARIDFHARPAAVVGRADVCLQGRCGELWRRDQLATLKVANGRLLKEQEPVKVAAQEAPKNSIGLSLTPLTRAAHQAQPRQGHKVIIVVGVDPGSSGRQAGRKAWRRDR